MANMAPQQKLDYAFNHIFMFPKDAFMNIYRQDEFR